MQHKEEEREPELENEEKRTENASAAAPYLGLALLTRPQADGSCWGSLGWRVALGGGGGGRGWKRVEKQREDGFRNRKKGLIRMVGTALLKDQLTEKGFLGRKGMQGKGGGGRRASVV